MSWDNLLILDLKRIIYKCCRPIVLMTLRHLIITIFILVPLLSFSQRTDIEEKAMDYYIKNIHEKGDKLKSTGRLEIGKGNYIGYVMGEYFVCKRRHAKDTAETRFFYSEYMSLGTNAIGELDTVNLKDLTVKMKEAGSLDFADERQVNCSESHSMFIFSDILSSKDIFTQ